MENDNKLRTIFEENGLTIYEEELDENIEMDSLQFISIISDIETSFHKQLSMEVYAGEEIKTYRDFYRLVDSLNEVTI